MDNQATSHLHPQKSAVTKVSTMVLIQVSPWKLLLEGLFKWSFPQRCCGSTFPQNMSEKSSNSTWSKVPELHNSGREQLHKERKLSLKIQTMTPLCQKSKAKPAFSSFGQAVMISLTRLGYKSTMLRPQIQTMVAALQCSSQTRTYGYSVWQKYMNEIGIGFK